MSRPTGRIHELEHHAADWTTTRPGVGDPGRRLERAPVGVDGRHAHAPLGGNAFDAVAAAGFAAAVIEPTASYTLCGECWRSSRRADARDARAERAGHRAGTGDDAFFRGRGLDRIPTGPGPRRTCRSRCRAPSTLPHLLETRGTKTVSEALTPALQYAEHGFPM